MARSLVRLRPLLAAALGVVLAIAATADPAHWAGEIDALTRDDAERCATNPLLAFVDVWPAMLDANGQPRPELFRPDMLHMKPAGYAIWVRLVTPLLPP